jgi:hypothetical protein
MKRRAYRLLSIVLVLAAAGALIAGHVISPPRYLSYYWPKDAAATRNLAVGVSQGEFVFAFETQPSNEVHWTTRGFEVSTFKQTLSNPYSTSDARSFINIFGVRYFKLKFSAYFSMTPALTVMDVLEVPPWMVAIPLLIAAGVVHRRNRPKPNRCRNCEYDLTGNVSGVCPECGVAVQNR